MFKSHINQSKVKSSIFYVYKQIPNSGFYYAGKYIMDNYGTLTPLSQTKLELFLRKEEI